jgi:hypothetical protein
MVWQHTDIFFFKRTRKRNAKRLPEPREPK